MTHMLPKMLLLLTVAGLLAGCPSYGPHSLLNSDSLDQALAVRSLRARDGERESYASAGVWGGSRSSTRLVGPPIYSGQTYYGATGIVSAPGRYGSYSSGSSYRTSSGYSYYSNDGYYSTGPGASYGRYFPSYGSGSTYYGPGTIGVWNGHVSGMRPVRPHGGRGDSGHGGHGGGHGGHTRPPSGHGRSGVTVQYNQPGLQIRVGTGSR